MMVSPFDLLLFFSIFLCSLSRTGSFQIVPLQISLNRCLTDTTVDPVPNIHGPLLSLLAESNAEAGMHLGLLMNISDFWVFWARIFPLCGPHLSSGDELLSESRLEQVQILSLLVLTILHKILGEDKKCWGRVH